ncbi:piggyBac transposable element-derived protein 4-like [Periplaneta americana]|uniref:piggyBac transposable element-derived protein 4-like n=1 Tax=Periplaneta americana TaxID=6978 RepID=UPI0037E8C227
MASSSKRRSASKQENSFDDENSDDLEELEELERYDSSQSLISDSDSGSDSEISVDDYALADVINAEQSDDEDLVHKSTKNLACYKWEDMKNYAAKREDFLGSAGPQLGARSVCDILSIFLLFFSTDLMKNIVLETNRYAEKFINSRVFPPRSSMRQWTPVTLNEMYILLGIFLLMGIIQKPTLRSYFARKRLISTPGVGDIISRDRMELICKFLRFSDSSSIKDYNGPEKLHKIYPIISHLNKKFQSLYLPSQNISVDKTLTLWKGKLSFKQYFPRKNSKFGMKVYELSESSTGYLWSFFVCTGKNMSLDVLSVKEGSNKTTAVVLTLLKPLLNKGYTVWMDNFHNSLELARFLKKNKTDCAGTVNLREKGMPKKVKEGKLKRGEIISQHSGSITIMKWRDKRDIPFISTYHTDEMKTILRREEQIKKPVICIDYNQNMGAVNQIFETYLSEKKKMHKWYMKIFRKLLNAAALNTMVLYKQNTGSTIDLLAFRITLVEEILKKFCDAEKKTLGRHASDNTVSRLKGRHFIRKILPRGKKSRPQRRCVVCSKRGKKKDTVYCCRECDVGLCLDGCFEIYHTKQTF